MTLSVANISQYRDMLMKYYTVFEHWCSDPDRGKPKSSEKTVFQCQPYPEHHFETQNLDLPRMKM